MTNGISWKNAKCQLLLQILAVGSQPLKGKKAKAGHNYTYTHVGQNNLSAQPWLSWEAGDLDLSARYL